MTQTTVHLHINEKQIIIKFYLKHEKSGTKLDAGDASQGSTNRDAGVAHFKEYLSVIGCDVIIGQAYWLTIV